jgi:uncharacterized membrane protein
MSKLEDFLSEEDEREIVNAIRIAESKTSGEIRVHIESSCKDNFESHVLEVFHQLKMDNTKLQNGVLIYIAINNKAFAIYGDKGINAVVANNFWDSTKETMQNHFKKGEYKEGIIEGVLSAGKELTQYFPWDHLDTNELSNEISKA